MLARKRNVEESLYINLMPMIDVILTLLIFFMAATKLYEWNEQQLNVKVPEVAAAKPLTGAPPGVVVQITRDGTVSIDGEPVSLPEVIERLRAARENYPGQAVLIRGDGQVYYQRVAEVMAACEIAGIRHLAVSVRETLKNQLTR